MGVDVFFLTMFLYISFKCPEKKNLQKGILIYQNVEQIVRLVYMKLTTEVWCTTVRAAYRKLPKYVQGTAAYIC